MIRSQVDRSRCICSHLALTWVSSDHWWLNLRLNLRHNIPLTCGKASMHWSAPSQTGKQKKDVEEKLGTKRLTVVQDVWGICCISLWALRNFKTLWTKPAFTLWETSPDEKMEEQKDSCGFRYCCLATRGFFFFLTQFYNTAQPY